jgi:hypothetical protein
MRLIKIAVFILIIILLCGCTNEKCIEIIDTNNTLKMKNARVQVYLLNEMKKFNTNPNILNKIEGEIIASTKNGHVCFSSEKETFLNKSYAITIINKEPFIHEVRYFNSFDLIPEQITPTGKFSIFLSSQNIKNDVNTSLDLKLKVKIKDFNFSNP